MASIFTKIIEREIPGNIIYEDDNHIAFLDINPIEKGHTLVVPKKEYETIFDMPEKEYLELQKIVFKIALHFEEKLECGINILQSNREIAGQEVPHVHFHVIPRRNKKKLYRDSICESYRENEKDDFISKLAL